MEETNRSLIILGNGFDLAHDLKTSYNDFILWYLNYCLRTLNDINNNSHYSDTLLKIQKRNTIIINRIDSIEEFIIYRETKQINILYENRLLNSIISQTKQFRWVDIESH
jgi:Bacteriophage abortive infection AbiH